MRKINGIIAHLSIVLFAVHAVAGAFQLSGIFPGGNTVLKILAYILVLLIFVHVAIGAVLTVRILRSMKKSGTSYFRENKLFWVRRISGFALFFIMIVHVYIFSGHGSGSAYRLHDYGVTELVLMLLMAAALAVHVIANVRPMLITLGIESLREYALDILIILALIVVFAAVGFVIYYFRWNG
ncbi:MAG: hypothetical protein K5637_05625 [Lachnospiraceae bacterium]|nr:hypothetical protein [Lachnospiraceae bacterium]